MLIIRLIRTGKRNASTFRVVLIDKTAPPKSGKFLEILGNYNPRLKEISLKKERIKYWLSQGVQTSATVHNLLVKEGVIEGPKIKKKIFLKAKKEKVKREEKIEEPAKEEKEEAKGKKKEEPKEETKGEPIVTKSKI